MYLHAGYLHAGLLAVHAVCVPAIETSMERHQATELHMGTKVTIILYATDSGSANRGLRAAFSRIRQLDERLSDYRSDSELSRLSRSAPADASSPSRPFQVSSDLWRILAYSAQLSQRTEGSFDITVGPLTRLWRRARRRQAMPSEERLAEARAAVGYEYVRLDGKRRTATLLRPNMRLDLGGIAKGFATDEALKTLQGLGIERALVNAGGDMAMGRAPPDRPGWRIGIAPLDADQTPSRFLYLQQCAIATSGDAWQSVEIDGRRYSHIVDPRTGLGLTTRSSVTVVAPNGMIADGLASALSVLGPERGLRLIDGTPGTAALVVQVEKGRTVVHQSAGFQALPKAP